MPENSATAVSPALNGNWRTNEPDMMISSGESRRPYWPSLPASQAIEFSGFPSTAEPKPDPALKRHALDRGGSLVVQIEQASRISQHRLARVSQREAAPGLAKDRRPRLFLQLLELGADRGGGAAEPFCRPREAAELHAGDETAQDFQIECNSSHGDRPHYRNK